MIQLLLDYGADPNLANVQGYSPLRCAIERGDSRMADLLLVNGASLETSGENKDTLLLQRAIINGHVQIVEILLANGVDPNHRVVSPSLPVAIDCDAHIGIIKMLLENGANPNALDCHGRTPLYLSVNKLLPNSDIVDLLLANRADPDVYSCNSLLGIRFGLGYYPESHSTTLQLAKRRGHIHIVERLENHIPMPYQPLMLKVCARVCIRARLVQNRANLAQTLSANSDCLPLPAGMKAFLYQPLSC